MTHVFVRLVFGENQNVGLSDLAKGPKATLHSVDNNTDPLFFAENETSVVFG